MNAPRYDVTRTPDGLILTTAVPLTEADVLKIQQLWAISAHDAAALADQLAAPAPGRFKRLWRWLRRRP